MDKSLNKGGQRQRADESGKGKKGKGEEGEDDAMRETTPSNPVLDLFGMMQEKTNTCCKCKVAVVSSDTVLLCNLLYPETKENSSTFDEVVCSSLCPDQTTPAWCEKCRKYQPTLQSRTLRTLPYVLSLNAGMDSQQDVDYWRAQMERLYDKNKPQEDEAKEVDGEGGESQKEESLLPQPPSNAKPCRYGLGCNRPDCKFWHPQQGNQDAGGPSGAGGGGGEMQQDVGDKLARLGLSWVPHEMEVALMGDGKVRVGRDVPEDEEEKVVERRKYTL